MRVLPGTCIALLVGAASPSTIPENTVTTYSFGCDAAVTLDSNSNIWEDYELHPNRVYRDIVMEAADNITDSADRAIALRIANTGNFAWM